MQEQAFRGPSFDDRQRWWGPDPREPSPPRPVKMLTQEKARQIERVKQFFPDEVGIVTDKYFSSRILPLADLRIWKENPDDIINLGSLIDEIFQEGEYEVKIDPHVRWGYEVATFKRFVESDGPEIIIYLKKSKLRGYLKAQMPPSWRKTPDEETDVFYATNAQVRKLRTNFVYNMSPNSLDKLNKSTKEVENKLRVIYGRRKIRRSEVIQPLTSQHALEYLTEELGLIL